VNRHNALPLTLFAWLPFAFACRTPAEETKRWSASDHDGTDLPQNVNAPSPPLASVAEASSPHSQDGASGALAMQAWVGKCMSCHGQIGAGDGPNGPISGARNLTEETWQLAVTDARIADAIQHGRGRMPAFPLEPAVIDGLVKLVRRMGNHGGATPDPPVASDPNPPKRPTNP
jgi:mono/diheme cytochrome c family protein